MPGVSTMIPALLWWWWLLLTVKNDLPVGHALTTTTTTTTTTQTKNDVVAIIVGAGPAGLCAALALSDLCDEIYVIEKRPSFEPQGSALVLKPNGIKALREIDETLAERVQHMGVSPNIPGVPGLLMPWWHLRDALLDRVREKRKVRTRDDSHVQILLGETLDRVLQEDREGVVVASLRSGREVRGTFLVGADGVHSCVRQQLGLPPGQESGSTTFRGHVRIDDKSPKVLKKLLERGAVPHPQVLFGDTFFASFSFHSKIPGLLSWVVATNREIPLDGSVTPMDLIGDFVKRKQKSCGEKNEDNSDGNEEWAEILEMLMVSNPESRMPFPPTRIIDLSDETLEKYGNGRWGGRGRITLLGDAAHAMNPTDGQGGSQAFEDVVILRRILLRNGVVSAGPDSCLGGTSSSSGKRPSVEESLREFEVTRLPRVKRIYEDQKIRLQRRYNGEEPEPWTEEYREWLESGV